MVSFSVAEGGSPELRKSKAKQRAIKRSSGRPLKLSPRQRAELKKLCLERPNATVLELRQGLQQRIGVSVAHQTMYNYLRRVGIKRAKARPVKAYDSAPTHATQQPEENRRYGYKPRHRQEGDVTRYPSCLTDAEWELVRDLFEKKGPGKPPKYPRRRLVDACCYVVRTGCPWRFVPKDFPAWQDVYAHFRRWTHKGLFETMHDRLRGMWRERVGREENPTAAVLDSQSYKTSAQGGPKGFDAAKRVNGRKRHVAVDVLGLMLAILVLPANVQDRDGAPKVVQKAVSKYPTLKKLYVDAAYGGECAQRLQDEQGLDVEVVRRVQKAGAWATAKLAQVEPTAKPFPILPRRWVVERTHAWIERPRRLSKDYDRLTPVSEAWSWLAETRLLLSRLTDTAAA